MCATAHLRRYVTPNGRFGTVIYLQGAADILLDENAMAQVARPGTSLARPLTSASGMVIHDQNSTSRHKSLEK